MKQSIFLEKLIEAKQMGLTHYVPMSNLAKKFEFMRQFEFYWHLYI